MPFFIVFGVEIFHNENWSFNLYFKAEFFFHFAFDCVVESLAKFYVSASKTIEIILVDDGSTDGSGDICEEYAAKDQRIHVIHQKNKGLSGARNAALDVMQGDYMTIVDGDDYVLPDAFAHAIRIMEENDLDRCGFGSFRGGKGGAGSGKISLSLKMSIMIGYEIVLSMNAQLLGIDL